MTDTFTRAYIDCALWSSSANEAGDSFQYLNYDEGDIAPEALERMEQDCADFQEANAELLAGLDDTQCGHDFWLTRNGHGAGFWDRGLGAIGKALTDAARPYGNCDLYLGDDDKIYTS